MRSYYGGLYLYFRRQTLELGGRLVWSKHIKPSAAENIRILMREFVKNRLQPSENMSYARLCRNGLREKGAFVDDVKVCLCLFDTLACFQKAYAELRYRIKFLVVFFFSFAMIYAFLMSDLGKVHVNLVARIICYATALNGVRRSWY